MTLCHCVCVHVCVRTRVIIILIIITTLIQLYTRNIYELAALYIINFNIHLTIKKHKYYKFAYIDINTTKSQ